MKLAMITRVGWIGLCLIVLSGGVAAAGNETAQQTRLIGVLPSTPGGTDFRAYYDPVTDLTWLADANANGLMNYVTAKQWAEGLNVGGITGWRLPKTPQPDPTCSTQVGDLSHGYHCYGSELGQMYYKVLGNPGLCDTNDNCTVPHGSTENKTGILQHTGPFKNLQPEYYWSGTDYNEDEPESAWYVDFRYGDQREVNKIYPMYAWPVHDGNVGHAKVPEKPGARSTAHGRRPSKSN